MTRWRQRRQKAGMHALPDHSISALLEQGDTNEALRRTTERLEAALHDRDSAKASQAAVLRSVIRRCEGLPGALSDAELAVSLAATPGRNMAIALISQGAAAQVEGKWNLVYESVRTAATMLEHPDQTGVTEMLVRLRVALHLRDRRYDLAWSDTQYLVARNEEGLAGLTNHSLQTDLMANRGETAAAEAGLLFCERFAAGAGLVFPRVAALVHYRTQWDQITAAAIARDELLALLTSAQLAGQRAFAHRVAAELHLVEGDIATAVALAQDVDSADLNSVGWRHRVAAAEALTQGDSSRVEAEVLECLRVCQLSADDLVASTALNIQARSRLASGDYEAARHALAQSAAVRSGLYAPLAARLDAEVEAAIADAAS